MGKEDITGSFKTLEVAPPRSDDGKALLVWVYPPGRDLGRRFRLDERELVVGRLDEVDIAIEEQAVSRRHARIYRGDDGWTVEDLQSTNGSWVNDSRIRRHSLSDGDLVRFGSTVFKFLAGTNIEAEYHEEIYRLSVIDHLTGVHNKRSLNEFLEREIARALRYHSPLSLILFDIDHFKEVNDKHGHPAGDAVLRELGRRLRPRIRREDLLARYGGEEFACVLASTGATSARRLAEDLRAIVAETPFVSDDLTIAISISVGVAELGESDRTTDALIARADQNLLAAKRAGRNRVVG